VQTFFKLTLIDLNLMLVFSFLAQLIGADIIFFW